MNLLLKFLIAGLILVLLLTGIQMFLKYYSDPIAFGGFSKDEKSIDVQLGDTKFSIPSNTIRFKNQRTSSRQERMDLFFVWPTFSGYSEADAAAFEDSKPISRIIFVSIEKGEPIGTASQRLEGIYRRFFTGDPWKAPGGLLAYSMDRVSGYSNEDVLYSNHTDGVFVTRCLREETAKKQSTRPTCLYSFPRQDGLNVHVRFDRALIKNWREIYNGINRKLSAMSGQ